MPIKESLEYYKQMQNNATTSSNNNNSTSNQTNIIQKLKPSIKN